MDWLAILRELGLPIGFLIVAIYAFVSGKVVPRWVFDQMREDRDEWRALSKRVADDLEHATRVTNTAVRKVVKG